jgi:hypothetical protein
MTIFLILAPFGAFTLLMLVTSATASLFAAAAVCLAVIAFDMVRGRAIKILGAGSAILFAALGFYLTLVDAGLSNSAVKLTVDAGVLAISLMSMAIRRPFTLQYALEVVDADTVKLPGTGPAAVVWTRDRIRRPQQRRLFHQMVSAIPAGKIRPARRCTIRFLISQVGFNDTQGEARR